jgi:hypothetical protein
VTLKEQFQSARELIENQQYDDARELLQNIDHPSAQKWIARVDEMDPPQLQQEQVVSQEESGGLISRIIGLIKSLFMGKADTQPQETLVEDVPQAQVQVQQEEIAEEETNKYRGTDMSGAYLRYAQLDGADLRSKNLTGAYLFGANLVGADLSDAVLIGANLIGANLAGAVVSGANFSETHLIGANLLGANFESAYLSGARLPDKSGWTESTDMTRFTNPNHPDFWQPAD